MKKLVLFDMMDTLVRDPYFSAAEKFFTQPKSQENFFQCKNRDSFISFEKGEISEKEYFDHFYYQEKVEQLSEKEESFLISPQRLSSFLFKNLRYVCGMKELLLSLQKEKEVLTGIASNYPEWYWKVIHALPELKQCDYLFFSCEMGSRKPEKSYYLSIQKSIQEYQKENSIPFVEECASTGILSSIKILFLDDRKKNLIPAEKLGWETHWMKNAYDAEDAIQKFLH